MLFVGPLDSDVQKQITTLRDFISPPPVPVEPAVDEGSLSGHEPSDKLV